jgi:hypothetical protein
MVDLQEGRDAMSLQTFDPPALPERTRPIERLGMEQAGQLREGRAVSRLRKRHAVNVVRDVEVFVLDPIGPVDAQRWLEELPLETLDELDPLAKDLDEALESELGAIRGVENREPRDMRGGFRTFDGKEDRVAIRQLLRRMDRSE